MWTFDGKALRAAIGSISSTATTQRPWMLAQFADGALTLTGDDMSTLVRVTVPAENTGNPFECGLPSVLTARVVKSLGGDKVTLAKQGDRIVVTADECQATLRITSEPPEFRIVPPPALAGSARRDRLCAAFDAVLPAMAGDSSSPLHSVRMEYARGDSWVVSTDKYRMHAVMLTGKLGFTEPVNVPPLALRLARSAIVDQMVQIGTVNDMFFMTGATGELSTRGITGPWLQDWWSFLRPPKDVETTAKFDASELAEAIRTVEEPLQAKCVTLELSPDDHQIIVSAQTDDGIMVAKCDAEVTDGASDVSFHASWLIDALEWLGDGATMTVPAAIAPAHFASANGWFQAIVSTNT